MTERRKITDPDVLKGLAQPLRRQLYRLLCQLGPATAGALAKRTESDPGLVSYHLRELGRTGYIEEAPELARDRRERWWRAVPGSTSWSHLDFTDPESRAIADTVKAQMVADQLERLRTYERERDSWPVEWVEAATSTEGGLRLTPDELRAMSEELQEVLIRWSHVGKGGVDDGREHVFMFLHAFPERP
ncbi:winged helix-turn-helix domain-containing protein [Allokutzneria albata]|uniref:Helix-turn-helix domain-containing protein n=1 Tax=Allokutzneria albata TaxID=211114 RepID=A0A1G9TPR3_ALLAB|nr:helix-turn-helix domain-containing protein [Allokutzneria albata]SDM49424.1 Helix-turn-helix domain-containing protein [Allokutzneria albata]